MDGPRDYHTKQSKSERKKIPYGMIYMWNLKYDTNEHTQKQKQTHRHKEQIHGCQGEDGLGKEGLRVWDQEKQTIYVEWVINKILLYTKKLYSISCDKT